MIRPFIYVAGKLSRAQEIVDLYTAHPEVAWVSSWPIHILAGDPDSPANATEFWQRDLSEISRADILLVLPDENLRGALVEAGAALALEKHVIVVGDCPSYGTWQYHPRVFHAADIPAGINIAKGVV